MLTPKLRSQLKSKCNTLKASIMIGKQGLTENVFNEIEMGLFHNEIVKVSVLKSCDTPAQELMNLVCKQVSAEPINVIGGKFVVYKYSAKEGIEHLL